MSAMDLRVVIGTLSHNRPFRRREVSEYMGGSSNGPAIVRQLLRTALIERVERGLYYPTALGWVWVDGGIL